MDLHIFCIRLNGDDPGSGPRQQLEGRLRNFTYWAALDEYSWFVISPRQPPEVISQVEALLDKRAGVTAVEVTRANLDQFPDQAALIERLTRHRQFPHL
jgi:hypothetical protein